MATKIENRHSKIHYFGIWALLPNEQGNRKHSPKQRFAKVISNQESLKDIMRKIADKLCEKYPEISTYEGVFNGKPHLKGTRFTVADVLTAICAENSIENVIEEYNHRFNEEQLKEAIEYARDFLLSAYSLP